MRAPPAAYVSSGRPTSLWQEILPDRWGLAYVFFLAYTFAMITGRIPIGTPAAVLGVLLLVFSGRKPELPGWYRWLMVFLLWSCVGLMTTSFPFRVQQGIVEFVKFAIVVGLGINVLRTRRQANFYLMFSIACYLMYPIRGTYWRYFVYNDTSFGRAIGVGIYENSNDLAALTLLQLSIAVALYMGSERKLVRLGALGAAASMALVIVLTQSRGVYLGTALFIGLMIRSQEKKARSIFALVVAGIVIALAAPEGTFDRFSRLTAIFGGGGVSQLDAEGSAEGRSAVYQVALQITRDNLVTGIGLDAYPAAHRQYSANSGVTEVSRGGLDTHSTYLNVIAETGLPGLIIYLTMIGVALREIVDARRRLKGRDPLMYDQLGVLLAGYSGFLLAALVGTYTSLALTYVHLCGIWAMAHTAKKEASLRGGPTRGPARRPRPRVRASRPHGYEPGMLPWGPTPGPAEADG